jgi:hypothetical protein
MNKSNLLMKKETLRNTQLKHPMKIIARVLGSTREGTGQTSRQRKHAEFLKCIRKKGSDLL